MTTEIDAAQQAFRSRFVEIVHAAAEALLSHAGPEFQAQAEPPSSTIDSAAVVGFVGPNIRGMFFVGVDDEKIKALRAELYEDWVGELANQLAGRVKNQLGRLGVSYDVSPPITLRGDWLRVATVSAQTSLAYSCLGGQCRVLVLLDVLQPTELKEVEANEAPASEGDLVLF